VKAVARRRDERSGHVSSRAWLSLRTARPALERAIFGPMDRVLAVLGKSLSQRELQFRSGRLDAVAP
jgi:hypothetical protein